MRKHWPLGLGNHIRSVVHTLLAGGVGLFALFIAVVEAASSYSIRPAASCRTWGLVLLAAFALEGAVLYLLRPGVLRLLTPTPFGRERLYRILDPARGLLLLALPYVLAVLAGLACREEIGPWLSVLWMFFAAMLFRALVPTFALLGVLLRKLLLPAGHWIVWGAAISAAIGLYAGSSSALADGLMLADVKPKWIWLLAGVVLIPVGSLVAWGCRRVGSRLISREELVEYAFPVEVDARPKARRMLVELLRPGARLRRLVFLVQESFGLHRAVDWGKAAVVWAVAFAVLVYAASMIGGSRAHMLLTVVPALACGIWCLLRRLRIEKGKLVAGAPDHALPVGYLELAMVQLLAMTCVYVVTGILAAVGVYLVWSPRPDGIEMLFEVLPDAPDAGPVRACAENLIQLWMILAALWVCLCTFAARKAARRKFDFRLRALPDTVVGWALYMGTIGGAWAFAGLAAVAGEVWTPVLATGGRGALSFATWLWLGLEFPLAAYLVPEYWAGSVAPIWRFEIMAWALPALTLAYFVSVLTRLGRGRAHPKYKSVFPAALPSGWPA